MSFFVTYFCEKHMTAGVVRRPYPTLLRNEPEE